MRPQATTKQADFYNPVVGLLGHDLGANDLQGAPECSDDLEISALASQRLEGLATPRTNKISRSLSEADFCNASTNPDEEDLENR